MSLQAIIRARRDAFQLHLDLTLPDASVLGVLGPSGAGKSTLLRVLAGLDRHQGTRLNVAGETWQDDTHFLPPEDRSIGYLAQQAALFPHLNVAENIHYGYRRVAADDRRIEPTQAIELLDIEHLLQRRVEHLSGGEAQRVALARALAASPRLLLLDEPLAGLDRQRRLDILPYLQRLNHELQLPMVYVSHERAEIEWLADQLLLLEEGQALALGALAEQLTRLDLPLALAEDAVAVLDGVLVDQNHEDGLTRLATTAGELVVSGLLPAGLEHCRLRIRALDVSLSLETPRGSSILNLLPARVLALASTKGALTTVQLAIGDACLLARITRRSARELALQPGSRVTAQIKCAALAMG